MSVEEAAAELREFQVDVHRILGIDSTIRPRVRTPTPSSWRCTAKGVRYALAQARTLDALLPPEDGVNWLATIAALDPA